MTKVLNRNYLILIALLFSLFSCKQTRYVGEDNYLLAKNKVVVNKDQKVFDSGDAEEVVKPKTNKTFLGMKLKLAFYNSVDTNKVAKIRKRKIDKNKKKNVKRRAKAEKKNDKRILRALKKGETKYKPKKPKLKDTLSPSKGFLDWWQNKLGEPPVVFDSSQVDRSVRQLEIYLKKRGFYYGSVKDSVILDSNKHKATVVYTVETGKPYHIDTIRVNTENKDLTTQINNFLEKHGKIKPGMIMDTEILDDQRMELSNFLRDHAYFGFSPSHVYYTIDTFKTSYSANIEIRIKDRKLQMQDYGDSIFTKKHQTYKIRNVYFHISDTVHYKGSYVAGVSKKLGSSEIFDEQGYFFMLDTLVTEKGTFFYNGKLAVRSHILELQNFLSQKENDSTQSYYKDKYVTQSYSRLMGLGVFSVVKPVIKEIGMTNELDVHYYLVPAKKQNFSFEPRGTHSNGFLGFSMSVSYKHRNLWRRAHQFKVSVSGGFESQPAVFNALDDSSSTSAAQRSFNTFDIGPSITYDMPGLFPFPARMLSKSQMPHTVMSAVYNYQKRPDFARHLIQLDYNWKWNSGSSQTFRGSLLNPIRFTFITESDEFHDLIEASNDLFIRNAYSSQFTWEDIIISHVFDNQKKKLAQGIKSHFYNRVILSHAGMIARLAAANSPEDPVTGQRKIFNVPFAQFVKIENESKYYQQIGDIHSINFRANIGFGLPYNNSQTTMPYDYSFFAGGSNDNRGHVARTLGPGAYKYYIDTNGTSTQIGDIKLALNVEYRLDITEMFKFAIFLDAGNIWTLRKDDNRVGGQISGDFYKQLALSTGIGLRLDFDFFIVRVDLGIPLNQPSFPDGEQWIWQDKRPQWHNELESTYGEDWGRYVGNQFVPRFNIGIGYPF